MKTVRTIFAGVSESVNIKAIKKQYTAPEIVESYVDDEGNVQHILENGNTQSETSYCAFWNKPKSEIKPKHYKGEGTVNFGNVR